VTRVYRHLLPWPADPVHADMPRIAIEADLASGIRVITTHLAYYSRAQRAVQVEALRALHAQAVAHTAPPQRPDAADGPFHWAARPAPAIIVGDFNCDADSTEYARLITEFEYGQTSFRDAWFLAHPGAPHAPSVGVFDHKQWPKPFCCDFAFVSADLAHRVSACDIDQRTDASDHQPVILALE
jgi:endonuclease/exonuclease/phosphatase family metal-dependent hydrolase